MTSKAKYSTAGATPVAQATDCAPVAGLKPTFTRPSAGVSRRYVASKSKTNPGVSPRDVRITVEQERDIKAYQQQVVLWQAELKKAGGSA